MAEKSGKKGTLLVVSAPSGAGKTTLCGRLLDRFPDICYSVSYTTRDPRAGEKDGEDYHFISREDFLKKLDRAYWAEWALVHDNYYGTSAAFLSDALAGGRDVLLDIDVQGTLQILERFPEAVTIFVMPPSLEVLGQRLEGRATDSPETIRKRLRNAVREMAQKNIYRHIVVNDELEKAAGELIAIVESYR
ncbi:MAG: guanylate kinase [Deltaproteobacteria bacterium]|nr:guanylate kinase [Deltaproteobacteria bacterium]